MNCYVCAAHGEATAAVAVCTDCGAAICSAHAFRHGQTAGTRALLVLGIDLRHTTKKAETTLSDQHLTRIGA